MIKVTNFGITFIFSTNTSLPGQNRFLGKSIKVLEIKDTYMGRIKSCVADRMD